MARSACVEFLKWALPQLGLRWGGFRKVRRQVCRRLSHRLQELGLGHPSAYRAYLTEHPEEWVVLDRCCTIPISRFFRDRVVFDALALQVLPTLAHSTVQRQAGRLLCWSAGCASGEEPYSLSVLWESQLGHRFPGLGIAITATDADPHLLERARMARYRPSSVCEIPCHLRDRAFVRDNQDFVVRPEFRETTELRLQDIRVAVPTGPFDLILCRNVVFTYFDDALQHRTLERIVATLRLGGALIIGLEEELPDRHGLDDWAADLGIYRKVTLETPGPARDGQAGRGQSPWT